MFRILLFGIIRTIRPEGPLDGLLGGRFIVVFLSVLCILGFKGGFIANVVVLYYEYKSTLSLSTATMIIALQFVPQIILSVCTTVGFSSSSMKMIIYHPETLLLSSGKQSNHKRLHGFRVSVSFLSVTLVTNTALLGTVTNIRRYD